MTKVPGDIDDLKTLQREAEELRESRKRASAETEKESGQQENPEDVRPSEKAVEYEKEVSQPDSEFHDFVEHAEVYLKEMEEAAMERPMLALLAAFSIGIVVGKLFTRR